MRIMKSDKVHPRGHPPLKPCWHPIQGTFKARNTPQTIVAPQAVYTLATFLTMDTGIVTTTWELYNRRRGRLKL